ncbi:mechanosensitive ion channel protein MscS [Anaerocolumna cellulosilytica]|uniref:Mechanosensitive ion channel protein MscS n=1 Tax=Anaerocolumna cellulosilytica TaxID=433286 RepID=A0A6S6R3G2_9FIRM|nr:mechanosensitive ion channel domain-containing protein [Anaerocolumna cellulosilytica]MBB5194201.1 small conductance mechanosensitive channel [Anaerocolumna cellulosilytica]BCJ94587.1 mechanosensitive ion channel protein MscS [Anaerocolumna cellulosilytica]
MVYGIFLEGGFKLSTFDLESLAGVFITKGLNFIIKLILSLILIIIGKKLIQFIINILEKSLAKSKAEASVSGFLLAIVRAVLYTLLVVIIVTSILGVESSSIVAIIGSVGLSIGLALQGSLSNFAGGVLILLLKPFKVGDYIIAGINEGTVTTIDIFYTRLLTVDNRLLVMPNGSLSNTSVINVTSEPIRRLDIAVTVNNSQDVSKVKSLLFERINNHEWVLPDKELSVFVSSFDANTTSIGIRVWTEKENFWNLKCQLLEQIKDLFNRHDIK